MTRRQHFADTPLALSHTPYYALFFILTHGRVRIMSPSFIRDADVIEFCAWFKVVCQTEPRPRALDDLKRPRRGVTSPTTVSPLACAWVDCLSDRFVVKALLSPGIDILLALRDIILGQTAAMSASPSATKTRKQDAQAKVMYPFTVDRQPFVIKPSNR
jgi:hypothetical protein